MKKYKVTVTTLSHKRDDGSRVTVSKNEICSCKDRGTAELINYLLLNYSAYRNLDNRNSCAANETMYLVTVEQ